MNNIPPPPPPPTHTHTHTHPTGSWLHASRVNPPVPELRPTTESAESADTLQDNPPSEATRVRGCGGAGCDGAAA